MIEAILAAIAARQPTSAEAVMFKVHEEGSDLHVECAYVRCGRVVSKTYHVSLSPSPYIKLVNFAIR